MSRTEPAAAQLSRPPARRRPGARPVVVFFAVLGIAVAVAVFAGLMPRLARQHSLIAAAKAVEEELPTVNVAPARLAPSKSQLELPGDLQPMVESPIFSRVDGYLKSRLVDVGDRITAGQLLAEIETPELDQQLQQARATLSQSQAALKELAANIELSKANLKLARVTLDRWKKLAAAGVFSRQESDEKDAAFAVREAELQAAEARLNTAKETVAANEAALRRLEEIRSFRRITAPFSGIISARNVDVGTLINAGASKEMFRLAQNGTVRVFVNVPQSSVNAIQVGQSAAITVQELPGQTFHARVSRAADSLDNTSRAMLAILEVPNPSGILKPGMFATVRFDTQVPVNALRIPGDALVAGTKGPRVAVVDGENRVHFHDIHVVRDYGSELEVSSGVNPGDLLVVNPGDAVREGAVVAVRKLK